MKLKIPFLDSVWYALGFFVTILRGCGYFMLRGQASFKILIMQILFTFVEALGISSLLAVGMGTAVIVIGMPMLETFSQEQLIYSVLIIMITREFGPILTAFIIIARSATAIATEMAGMVISHEIEAYISVGVNPIEHLAVPRFLGVTASMFLLNLYFSLFGLVGSFFVAQFIKPMPPSIYFNNLLQVLTLSDIVITIVKSVVFGMIISTIAVIQGLAVERASTEIPVAGLRAVSSAFVGCILVDIILCVVYYSL
ncbi:MAG: ABC transporter permease [Spirochaetaceae bacterium]|jgi:phospholipid/cholesterol/gamma-HCH transport system permease protein|nr:ABC transporter permease [Spirochaetaceae bacterium]